MISAATEDASTANIGTRSRFRRRNSAQPGIPLSRENAYHVREQEVSPAAPQNSWPTVQMSKTALAAAEVRAVSMIGIEPPPFSVIAGTLEAANTSESSTAHPAIAEKNTERQTPFAAPSAAPRVSSAVCAEASYPVCVYIVRMKPIGSTYSQKNGPLMCPPW